MTTGVYIILFFRENPMRQLKKTFSDIVPSAMENYEQCTGKRVIEYKIKYTILFKIVVKRA